VNAAYLFPVAKGEARFVVQWQDRRGRWHTAYFTEEVEARAALLRVKTGGEPRRRRARRSSRA
jgi:hypothetical protein